MNNKFCLAVILLLTVLQIGCAHASDDREILERSVGKLILMHDYAFSYEDSLNPFADGPIAHEAAYIYEKEIKHLSEKSKVQYFWVLITHFGFFLSSEDRAIKVQILRDCGPAFFRKLEKYIKTEEEMQRDDGQLDRAKKVLRELKWYENSKEWKEIQLKGNYEDYIPAEPLVDSISKIYGLEPSEKSKEP
jgi:hypothetical protein